MKNVVLFVAVYDLQLGIEFMKCIIFNGYFSYFILQVEILAVADFMYVPVGLLAKACKKPHTAVVFVVNLLNYVQNVRNAQNIKVFSSTCDVRKPIKMVSKILSCYFLIENEPKAAPHGGGVRPQSVELRAERQECSEHQGFQQHL